MYANYPSYKVNDSGEIYGATTADGKSVLFGTKRGKEIVKELDKQARHERKQKEYDALIPKLVQNSKGEVFQTDKAGNVIVGKGSGGKNLVTSSEGYTPYTQTTATEETQTVESLYALIMGLKTWVEEQVVKDQIIVAGSFDGTNIPVTVNGIRRKIATVAP